jgi:C4-type Zn-finger protein
MSNTPAYRTVDCPSCQVPMKLVAVIPAAPHVDEITFRCGQCGNQGTQRAKPHSLSPEIAVPVLFVGGDRWRRS